MAVILLLNVMEVFSVGGDGDGDGDGDGGPGICILSSADTSAS